MFFGLSALGLLPVRGVKLKVSESLDVLLCLLNLSRLLSWCLSDNFLLRLLIIGEDVHSLNLFDCFSFKGRGFFTVGFGGLLIEGLNVRF